MNCVVCGSAIKKQGAATRIYWKLYTCHARACVKVFQSLSTNEQEYIHLKTNGSYHLKTKDYIATLDMLAEFRYEQPADFDYYSSYYSKKEEEFKELYGCSVAEVFESYKTFIEANNEKERASTDPFYRKNVMIPAKEYCYIEFDVSYSIYFPPDFSKIAYLHQQYQKLYKLELGVSSLVKASRHITDKSFGLCSPCSFSIIRTNNFKQFDI